MDNTEIHRETVQYLAMASSAAISDVSVKTTVYVRKVK